MESANSDALLIALVEKFPSIYGKKRKDYRDKNAKENSWEQIAEAMGQSGNYICLLLSIRFYCKIFHIYYSRRMSTAVEAFKGSLHERAAITQGHCFWCRAGGP